MSELEEKKCTWIQFAGKHGAKVAVNVDQESVSISVTKEDTTEDHVRLSNDSFACILAIFTQLKAGAESDDVITWLRENPDYRVHTIIDLEKQDEVWFKENNLKEIPNT